MTAMAAMMLVEEGRINPDLPVTAYIPYFKTESGDFGAITTWDLLSHRSGLPDVLDFDLENHEFDNDALERQVRGVARAHLKSPPGESYSYSDVGYETLGHLVAVLAEKSFEDFVEERLLRPAGMKTSSLCFRDLDARDLASSHHDRGDGLEPSDRFPYNRRHAPSSTLCSCAEDMTKWIRFCDEIDSGDRPKVLTRASYRRLRKVSSHTNGIFWTRAGYGFFSGSKGGIKYHGHEGSDAGFRALLVMIPSWRGGIALMSNLHGDNLKPLVEQLIRCVREK